jgi:hypothetical protein
MGCHAIFISTLESYILTPFDRPVRFRIFLRNWETNQLSDKIQEVDEYKDIELRNFSGTGNSYKNRDTCKQTFIQDVSNATLASITDKRKIHEGAVFIGFYFPVYAFRIPGICKKYLLGFSKRENPVNAFLLITAGESEEAALSTEPVRYKFVRP